MKNLNAYPTPETDAAIMRGFPPSGALGTSFGCVEDYVARDLERRLAACRDALKLTLEVMLDEGLCDNPNCTEPFCRHAICIAQETLTATEKP